MHPQASHINKLIIALSVTMRTWKDKMDSFKGCNINSIRDTLKRETSAIEVKGSILVKRSFIQVKPRVKLT